MKTSELKKIVEDNGRMIDFFESGVLIINNKSGATIGKVSLMICKKFLIDSTCPKVIAQAILDYAYTPLEEREEEKKYYLKSKLKDRDLNELFIVKGGELYNYEMYLSPSVRNQFTQKEIDEMPFDTNFFEKVLVE